MKEMGHDVYVIAAGRNSERSFDVIDGVQVTRISVNTTKRKSLDALRFGFLAGRTLSGMIVKNNIRIVHVFSYIFAFLVKLGTFSNSHKVKWVYDIRTGPVEDKGKPSLIYRLSKVFLKLESSFFNVVFVIDEVVKKEILGIHTKRNVIIVPLGADLQIFKPALKNPELLSTYRIQMKGLSLVYLGSLSPRRKIKNLILAFWKASMKIKDLQLIIIGDGEDLYRIRKLTSKLSLSDKVFFLGYINYAELPEFLSAMDVAVSYVPIVPGYDAQPPTKTVEYLACSLPVIATSTRGNRRFIVHEKNGLLTRDDPTSLAKAIIRLSQDESLREKLSQMARPSVEDYDWGTIVRSRILPAYRKILQTQ